ncbi:hypothetical protein GOBAR_AA08191 [Gossypium barbadense]|uniref:Uncharacterized protein n=1 Tax=Gossypium barbadense TaxID=3634 RepID=A0A2P5YA38_GOSBA|nr:hypothetical protein GOBAR_AA08191 [Gossypium barbadense]
MLVAACFTNGTWVCTKLVIKLAGDKSLWVSGEGRWMNLMRVAVREWTWASSSASGISFMMRTVMERLGWRSSKSFASWAIDTKWPSRGIGMNTSSAFMTIWNRKGAMEQHKTGNRDDE